jgi:hypothetical protein
MVNTSGNAELLSVFFGRGLIKYKNYKETSMKPSNLINRATILVLLALTGGSLSYAGERAVDISSYSWNNVRPTVPFDSTMWAPRAGLQAVELRNDLYIMGGRGPFSITAETQLFGDVWKSSDAGETWNRTALWQEGQDDQQMWSPRAYFGSVTHRGRMFVLGGQNFESLDNPNCGFLPPGVPCFPIPNSTFFDEVWSSKDGVTWTAVTTDAPWEGRAGLSAVVHKGAIYILGGSQGDDVSTGGTGRVLFDDVWMSRDGRNWTEVVSTGPKWDPRAGAAVVSKNGYLYVLGGERGFSCGFELQSPCQPATSTLYFNDVWRSADGTEWEPVTPSAGWSPRPGHQCVVVLDQIVCFGGYGEIPGWPPAAANPMDIWSSKDGETWTELTPPASPPWNAGDSDGIKYDFDAVVISGGRRGFRPSIMTFGGDRERFGLSDEENASLIDNDVWRLTPLR